MTDLKKLYDEEIKPKLKEELGLANVMQVPRITHITLNMGVGEALNDRKQLDAAVSDMQAIAGQKADYHECATLNRWLQDSRRLSDWL